MNLLKNSDVYIGLLALMVLGVFVPSEIFVVASFAYFLFLVAIHGFNVYIPKVPGLKLYLIVIIYSFFVGCFLYSLRNVIRDLYYVAPTVIWIFIGYHIFKYDNGQKNVFKTLLIYGGIVSLKSIIDFIFNFSFDFNELRTAFGVKVYEIGFILPISVSQVFFYGKKYVSRVADRIIILLMFIQVILSMGRIALLEPAIVMFILLLLSLKYNPNKKRAVIYSLILIGLVIVSIIVLLFIIPDTIKDTLFGKFLNSFDEINSNQQTNPVSGAAENWRGYEIHCAQEQWLNSNIFEKIFGSGLGKGIHIDYIPPSWYGVVVDNQIPILHNGFYTFLIKGGLLGEIALILLILGPVYIGFKNSKEDSKNGYALILIAMSVATVATTYVIGGPVKQGCFMVWAFLLGWINAYLNDAKSARLS